MSMRSGTEDAGFWRKQGRIIHALIVRETYTRFGRDNIGFAWIVVEPALFCLGIIALWTAAVSKQNHVEIPIVAFLLTGYMPLLMYRHAVARLLRCMQANAELLYHRDVTVFAMYAARLTLEIVGAFAAFVLLTGFFYAWGLVAAPKAPSLMLAGFLVYALFTVAVSVAVGALSERSEAVDKFWQPISYVMIPLSGTFYMLYWLPPQARDILVWFPPVTGVEMIRSGYFGPSIPAYYEWPAAVATSATVLCLGLALLRGARRHVEIG